MTYLDLIRDADRKLDKGDITLGEYEEMIEPLKREIDHIADSGKKVSISCGQENDLISRQAAIDALDEQIEQCNKALGSFDISPKDEYAIKVERASLKAYKEQLENMPSVQPERKRGKWIPFDIPWYRCSECGAERENTVFMEYFCPNCGADMRGGGSNE